MSIWLCNNCGAATGGSVGAPKCESCGSLQVSRVKEAEARQNERLERDAPHHLTSQFAYLCWQYEKLEKENQELRKKVKELKNALAYNTNAFFPDAE